MKQGETPVFHARFPLGCLCAGSVIKFEHQGSFRYTSSATHQLKSRGT